MTHYTRQIGFHDHAFNNLPEIATDDAAAGDVLTVDVPGEPPIWTPPGGGPSGSGAMGPRGPRGRKGERGPPGPVIGGGASGGGGGTFYTVAYFEAIIAATGGYTCTARLFDTTAAAEVSGSPVTTSASTPTRVRSSAITLPVASHIFRADWGGPAFTGTFTIYAADIIVDTYSGAVRVARAYISFGINQSGQSVTP